MPAPRIRLLGQAPSRKIGTIQWPSRTPGDPERDFVTTAVDPMDREDLQPWCRAHSVKGRRVVIFVHGFNTRFDDSVFRLAQIIHDSRADVAPILFSWPSRGSIFDYNYDRESTNFSRADLVYVIRQAVRSRDVSEITIMAHSMGCWLAVEALRDILHEARDELRQIVGFSAADEIAKLDRLKSTGSISDQEYARLRAKLVG